MDDLTRNLLGFFRGRGMTSDATELVQEVYARMLQAKDPEAIRNPAAYLYQVAANLAREHRLRQLTDATPLPHMEDQTAQWPLMELGARRRRPNRDPEPSWPEVAEAF